MPTCYRLLFAILLFAASALHAQDEATRELIQAVEKGDVQAVKSLLKEGVDVHGTIPSSSPFYLFFLSRDMYLNGLTQEMNHEPVYVAAIHANASRANQQVLKVLLKKRANIDAGDSEGKTPLMYALRSSGGEEYALLLIRKGANYTTVDHAGNTAMHYAAFGGNMQGVQMTLTGGTDINTPNHQGITPIHAAAVRADLSMLQSMVDLGADILHEDSLGFNILHYAAGYGNKDKLRWILQQSPNLQKPSKTGLTPMDIAKRAQNEEAITFLRSKGGKYSEYRHHDLLSALHARDHLTVQKILNEGACPDRITSQETQAPLHIAAAEADILSMAHLLAAGADPNEIDSKGRSAVDLAFETGNAEIVRTLLHYPNTRAEDRHLLMALEAMRTLETPGSWEDVALALIPKVKNLDAAGGKMNMPALHYAAYLGHLPIAKALLEKGADAKLADHDGWTALHWAMMKRDLLPRHPEKVEIARLILAHGCPLDAVSTNPKKLPHTLPGLAKRVPASASAADIFAYTQPRDAEMAGLIAEKGIPSKLSATDRTENAAYFFQTKDYSAAMSELDIALMSSPGNPNALYLRAECKRLTGKPEDAERDYTEAMRLAGPQPEIGFGRGKVRHDLGKAELAIPDLDLAVKSAELRAEALYWRGKCKLKTGKRVEACDDLEASLAAGNGAAASAVNLYCK